MPPSEKIFRSGPTSWQVLELPLSLAGPKVVDGASGHTRCLHKHHHVVVAETWNLVRVIS